MLSIQELQEREDEKIEITCGQVAALRQCWCAFGGLVSVLGRSTDNAESDIYHILVPLSEKMDNIFEDMP